MAAVHNVHVHVAEGGCAWRGLEGEDCNTPGPGDPDPDPEIDPDPEPDIDPD